MLRRFSYFARGTPCPASLVLAWFLTVLCRIFRCRGPKKFVNNLWLSVFTRYSFRNPLWLPFRRIKEKAPYKMNQDGYCYPFSIQFRTVLGGFSVLTDPAPLARLEIVLFSIQLDIARFIRSSRESAIQFLSSEVGKIQHT